MQVEAEREQWLSELKPGDVVVINRNDWGNTRRHCIAEVVRKTGTLIVAVTDKFDIWEWKFRRDDGWGRGIDKGYVIDPANSDDSEKWKIEVDRQRKWSQIRAEGDRLNALLSTHGASVSNTGELWKLSFNPLTTVEVERIAESLSPASTSREPEKAGGAPKAEGVERGV